METIYFSRWILTENGKILENGALGISDQRISYVGHRSKARKNNGGQVINLGDTLLLPGLINLHTHLEEAGIRGIHRNADETFAGWSAKKNSRLRHLSKDQIESSIRLSVRELISNGTTAIADSSKYGFSAGVLDNELIRSWVIHELHPDDSSQENEDAKQLLCKIDEASFNTIKVGMGPYALFSISPDIQRDLIHFAQHRKVPWFCHVAESAEELQAFTEKKGDLFFHIIRKKTWPFADTPLGSLHYALEENLIPERGICIHCNYSSSAEISQLAALDATVVHCPTYSHDMNHKRLPLDVILNRNLRLCIGTEGESEPGAMSLFDELFVLKQQYPHIKAREMIKWITSNPAEALGVGNELGSLSEGKLADLIGVRFPSDDSGDLVEQMIQSDLEIVMVMINGQEVIVNY